MVRSKQSTEQSQAKKDAVFEAAAEVFARYGYRRTTMNDIAEAAGISRPALYLIFENKENLFCELSDFRLNQAIDVAIDALATSGELRRRFIQALLIFEKVYYEPVSNSPHGEELMDTNQSLAADVMMKGFARLVTAFANELKEAEQNGEASFDNTPLTPKTFVELLISALGGIKKKAKNTADFRRQTEQVAQIFLSSIVD
ncbi:MAG: TetR/AcrR family transcriptional regulator [Gammaproteobacteria bacterium]|nr:TetR/AcrR family transcriptional regulator [Gammaproteobacteria bacterium]